MLGEELRLSDADLTLNYRSSRVPGRSAARTIAVPATGGQVPASLDRVKVTMTVAGKRVEQELDSSTGQLVNFTWDGKDAYGRTVPGR